MAVQLEGIQFFNHGFCWQSQYFTANGRWAIRRFQAVAIYFRHPKHGDCLIDCGYGPGYLEATRHFPARLLRWTIPVAASENAFTSSGDLQALPVSPSEIDWVFISHFHGDHIGGMSLFENCHYVCRADALMTLRSMPRRQQIHHGFLEQLLPSDFDERRVNLSVAEWRQQEWADSPMLSGLEPTVRFPAVDFWQDGSLILFDAPGHALGHTGFVLNGNQGPMVYAVDAFWDAGSWLADRELPWVARCVQADYPCYRETQRKLLAMHRQFAGEVPILGCHCPRTQEYVKAGTCHADRLED